MPDNANVHRRTPSARRHLVVATLIVWALVVAAAALIGLYAIVAMLIVTAAVFSLIRLTNDVRITVWDWVVGVLIVVTVVFGALLLLRNTLRTYPCDASGTDPKCQISHAPGP